MQCLEIPVAEPFDTRITIAEAAKLMHVTPMFLRLALRKKLFDFGECIQQTGERYTYYINRARFLRYLYGENK